MTHESGTVSLCLPDEETGTETGDLPRVTE